MSVTITITDPSSTPPEELQAVLTMLSHFVSPLTINVGTSSPQVREAAAQGTREAVGSEEKVAVAAIPDITAVLVPPPAGSVILEVTGQDLLAFAEETRTFAPATVFGMSPPPPPTVAALEVGVELDKDGLPWDGRIHASTKTKTVEGVWKKKRGVEQSTVDAVTIELRAVMGAPAPTGSVVSPITGETFTREELLMEAPATVVPPPPPATVPPPPPAATGITFAEFMGHVTAGVTSARFTREAVAAACVAHGIPNLPGLINRPDLIPAVARELGLVA